MRKIMFSKSSALSMALNRENEAEKRSHYEKNIRRTKRQPSEPPLLNNINSGADYYLNTNLNEYCEEQPNIFEMNVQTVNNYNNNNNTVTNTGSIPHRIVQNLIKEEVIGIPIPQQNQNHSYEDYQSPPTGRYSPSKFVYAGSYGCGSGGGDSGGGSGSCGSCFGSPTITTNSYLGVYGAVGGRSVSQNISRATSPQPIMISSSVGGVGIVSGSVGTTITTGTGSGPSDYRLAIYTLYICVTINY